MDTLTTSISTVIKSFSLTRVIDCDKTNVNYRIFKSSENTFFEFHRALFPDGTFRWFLSLFDFDKQKFILKEEHFFTDAVIEQLETQLINS